MAASLAGLNAYHANINAYINAAPGSRVGLIALYVQSLVAIEGEVLAALAVGLDLADMSLADAQFLLGTLQADLGAADLADKPATQAQINELADYIAALEASYAALDAAANPNRVPVDPVVKTYLDQELQNSTYLDQELQNSGILDYLRSL